MAGAFTSVDSSVEVLLDPVAFLVEVLVFFLVEELVFFLAGLAGVFLVDVDFEEVDFEFFFVAEVPALSFCFAASALGCGRGAVRRTAGVEVFFPF